MSDKKGTLLGRTLLRFIPDDSPFHDVAEAADLGMESLVFDKKNESTVPAKELPEVKSTINGLKGLLLFGAKKGIVAINFPLVDGEEEAQAEAGAYQILEAYVNEFTH